MWQQHHYTTQYDKWWTIESMKIPFDIFFSLFPMYLFGAESSVRLIWIEHTVFESSEWNFHLNYVVCKIFYIFVKLLPFLYSTKWNLPRLYTIQKASISVCTWFFDSYCACTCAFQHIKKKVKRPIENSHKFCAV